jgi:hypothetical protein
MPTDAVPLFATREREGLLANENDLALPGGSIQIIEDEERAALVRAIAGEERLPAGVSVESASEHPPF